MLKQQTKNSNTHMTHGVKATQQRTDLWRIYWYIFDWCDLFIKLLRQKLLTYSLILNVCNHITTTCVWTHNDDDDYGEEANTQMST